MVQTKSTKKHVAVLAFPFGCHSLALLNLVKKLAVASPDTNFSFLSTSNSNNSFLLPSKSNTPPNNITSYNVGDGVPMNHVFSGNPVERLELFTRAAPDNFRKVLDLAMADMGQISSLITDAFLVFSGSIAEDLRVPWIAVWIPVPHSLSAHIYTTRIRQYHGTIGGCDGNDGNGNVSDNKILETIPGLAKMTFQDIPAEVFLKGEQENLFSSMMSQIEIVLPKCTTLVMNFYQELYPTVLLDDLKSKFPSLLNVGFVTLSMPPPPLPLSSTDATGCLSWLDSQKTKSVVYISFGTVVRIPPDEIKELAEAILESKIPFLWALRENLRGNLPDEFLENISFYGNVVAWAPQAQVLGHNSVGVYVTHCGANSVYESMANGVPVICRPVFADNMINARIVEDVWGTGVRVDGGVFTKNGVIKNLKLILGHDDEQGRRIRKNVQEFQELVLKAAAPTGHGAQDFKALVEKISSN